ncbi:MAG: hypothetical protein QXK37_05550 [Candidatus Woesearchaeota archaeon]
MSRLAYIEIVGVPLIVWLGIIALCFILASAVIAALIRKGYSISIKWHIGLSIVGIILAITHAVLALSANF